jgi:hypothetical protein
LDTEIRIAPENVAADVNRLHSARAATVGW